MAAHDAVESMPIFRGIRRQRHLTTTRYQSMQPIWGLIPESAGSYVKPLGLLFWPPVFACEEDMCPSEG